MHHTTPFGNAPDPQDDRASLAHWLQEILASAPQHPAKSATSPEGDHQLALVLEENYHLRFYQQLPNFVMALLQNDAEAPVRYAPLLFHLVGCTQCHSAYLDLYDSLQAAVYPQGVRPLLGQGTRTLGATPHRMLSHLCQALISQAEAVLYQARHEHTDQDASARSLLQLALRVSAHITQSALRRQALQDLVRVATLFSGPAAPAQDDPAIHVYTPVAAGTGGMRRGKTLRRADLLSRSNNNQEQPVIDLQSQHLEGYITQNGQVLELHLYELDPALRGRFVTISVLLGSLLEPVRWVGGNPLAIRSAGAVDASGSLVTPLGQTDLQLTNPEERNLLEALFLLLKVHASDYEG